MSRSLTLVLRITLCSLVAAVDTQADIINVPDDYSTVQAAIKAAVDGDEIVVAPGTYLGNINLLGKAITLRSSDGPDVTIIDGFDLLRVIVCNNGEGPDTVIDGFTITRGFSPGGGGGMYNSGSSPTVTNCRFVDNYALFAGGGMFNGAGSNATVTHCTFTGNRALEGEGGGMFNVTSSPLVTHCLFVDNAYVGGGIFNSSGSSPIVAGCLFYGNTGAGVRNDFDASPMLINCTFAGNMGGGLVSGKTSTPTVTNCILWNNNPGEIFELNDSSTTVSYSDVQGGWPGVGNISADPLFVDIAGGDLHLLPASPCIDAGDNTAVPEGIVTDLDGLPRFVDDPNMDDTGLGDPPIVDMGPYELQDLCADDDGDGLVTICHIPPGHSGNAHTIAVSVHALPAHLAHGDQCGPCADGLAESAGGPATGSCCITDGCSVLTEEDCAAIGGEYVGDGTRCVGPSDLAQLLGWWGPCEPSDPCHEVDADANGDIGPFDLAVLLGVWGPCPQ